MECESCGWDDKELHDECGQCEDCCTCFSATAERRAINVGQSWPYDGRVKH